MARVRSWLFCHQVSWYLKRLSIKADFSFSRPSSPPSCPLRSGCRLGPALRALIFGFKSLSLPVSLYLCTRASRSSWRPSRSISLKSPPVLLSLLIKVHSRISSVPSTRSTGLALSHASAAFHSCTVVRGTSMCLAICVTRQPIQYRARALRRLSSIGAVKACRWATATASAGPGRKGESVIPGSLVRHSRPRTCAKV